MAGEVPTMVTRAGLLSKVNWSKQVGFWYYIFGEGKLENYVRRLPITSRSSHGQTTRGSSMTVEVFYPGDTTPMAKRCGIRRRAAEIDSSRFCPTDRAEYHIP